jgi:hypothetical protein
MIYRMKNGVLIIIFYEHTEGIFDAERARLCCQVSMRARGLIYNG